MLGVIVAIGGFRWYNPGNMSGTKIREMAGIAWPHEIAAKFSCISHDSGVVWQGDNLQILRAMPSASVPLIYIDPPFNTGKTQSRKRIKVVRADDGKGDRTGFGGKSYRTQTVGESGYADSFGDYLGFLRPRLEEAHRILAPNGSLFFHIDWREAAHCRLLLENIFGGSDHCINEIIWAYDYGARSKSRWSTKHDNIYWFAKNPRDYIFENGGIDGYPYNAPPFIGAKKPYPNQMPTDTWWNTIVPTNGGEKTGYPTQKPLAILERVIRIHSRPGDLVLDFFAGSGTTGVAAAKNGRRFVLVDRHAESFSVIKYRLFTPGKHTGEADGKQNERIPPTDTGRGGATRSLFE